MARLLQPTPCAEMELLHRRMVNSHPRSSSSSSYNRAAMQVNLLRVSFICFTPRPLGGRETYKALFPRCSETHSISTLLSTGLNSHQGHVGMAAKKQGVFGGGHFVTKSCTSPGDSSLHRVPTAGFKDKFRKGFRKVERKRTKLEERLERGFKRVGLERQFGELPQWSAYVPLVAGGLQTLVIVGWTVYLNGDLRGSSMFNLSGEGLLTLLLGTNFVVGWLASQMSSWRVQDLAPSLLGRGKKAARPGILDFIGSFVINVIPYGNFLAWTRFAWKESSSVSSLNALVYVVPSLFRLVLWSQGLTFGRVEFFAWVLGAIHRPYDAARVENERLLSAADAKLESARKAKEEKEQLEKGPELTVDEIVLLQQRKELEDFDILLAKSTSSTASIPGFPKDWSVGDTLSWLAQEGFVRYATTFADNDIDGAILLQLTEDDLRDELGIQSLGDRKKLTQAIQRLK